METRDFIGRRLMVMNHLSVLSDMYLSLDAGQVLYTFYRSIDGKLGMIRAFDLDGNDVWYLRGWKIQDAEQQWSQLLEQLKESFVCEESK